MANGWWRKGAKAGARALSAWLKRCRATVGVVKGKSFTKVWGALVESVLLYSTEVCGCGRQALLLEQVQLRAARIFLGGWETTSEGGTTV